MIDSLSATDLSCSSRYDEVLLESPRQAPSPVSEFATSGIVVWHHAEQLHVLPSIPEAGALETTRSGSRTLDVD